ncbi:MAG: hypothetical protein IJ009_01380 [Clostridia bacterium]|nr:hypothetical protein [Clostridia bacterium]
MERQYVRRYPYTDEQGVLHLTYQERHAFPCPISTVADVHITSRIAGTDTPDPCLLVREGERGVYAKGCGTAKVHLADGSCVKVSVHAAPLNLLLVTGQSNASADASFWSQSKNPVERAYAEQYHHTYADYYVRTRPGKAYFTWTGQALSLTDGVGHAPAEYVSTTLDWESAHADMGADPRQFSIPRGKTSFPSAGWSAALAHEWVEQTNESVWVVNASHGGRAIEFFKPSENGTPVDNEYYQAVAVFRLALETIYREIDAGHFTLHHFFYYWYHGGGDSFNPDDYYYDRFAELHAAMKRDVVFDHAGVRRELEFCGLFCNRSKFDEQGNGTAECYLNGPRLAQYYAASEKKGIFSDVYFLSNVTEKWTDGDKNVERYFLDTYGSPEKFEELFGYPMPTTCFELHPTCHYLMQGHNEMGMDCARNTLRLLNLLDPSDAYRHTYPEADCTVRLLSQDGCTEITDSIGLDETNVAVVYPEVSPVYYTALGVELSVEGEGFVLDSLFKLRRTDPTRREVRLSVTVGGKRCREYTLRVNEASFFHTHLPYFDQPGFDDEGYWHCNFYGMHEPWSVGYLTFSDKTYIPYHMFSNGWLTSAVKGYKKPEGGILAKLWYVGISPSTELAPAICYTAERDGVLTLGATQFSAGCNRLCEDPPRGVFLAVARNGDMVWPSTGGSLAGEKTDWFFASTEAAEPISLAERLGAVRIPVKKGDLVQFCFGRECATEIKAYAQPILFPSVCYED